MTQNALPSVPQRGSGLRRDDGRFLLQEEAVHEVGQGEDAVRSSVP